MQRRLVTALAAVAVLGMLPACASSGGSGPGTSTARSAPPPTSSSPAVVHSSSPAPSSTRAAAPRTSPRPTRSHRSGDEAEHPRSAPAPTTSSASSAHTGSAGQLVVLDPGHNGGNASHPEEINKQVPAGFGAMKACNTTGTNTNAGYPEHTFTFSVAERVRSLLRAQGVRVIMTRSTDTGVGPCVNKRAAIQSQAGVDAAVSIHADGAPSSGQGFHVCYASRRPDGATTATMADSKSLSEAVHDALQRESGLVPSTYIGHDGYYPRSDMAGLNLSTSPTTFLELGNMRNAHDAGLQSSAGGRNRIAVAITAGILHYLDSTARR